MSDIGLAMGSAPRPRYETRRGAAFQFRAAEARAAGSGIRGGQPPR
jgi:hypothetical protein